VFDASTIIALAGIISGAAVGIFAPLFTNRSESERLGSQLAFQRGETDRAELREILDTLSGQLGALPDGLVDVQQWSSVVEARKRMAQTLKEEDDPLIQRDSKRREDAAKTLKANRLAAAKTIERVRLRLTEEPEVLEIARSMLVTTEQAMVRWTTGDLYAKDALTLEEAANEVRERYEDLVKAARGFTEAQLYRPSDKRHLAGSVNFMGLRVSRNGRGAGDDRLPQSR